jgi:hypothetical protein
MIAAGLVACLAGFGIALFSLQASADPYVRLGIVLVGIAVSLFGIVGLINPAYVKNAIWKKGTR